MISDDNGFSHCRSCTVCPPGFQIKEPCTEYTDTVCEACPRRTYNPGTWDTCKKCTRCKIGYHVAERCTAAADTVCRPCPEQEYSPRRNSHYCFRCSKCRLFEDVIANCTRTSNTRCGNCSRDYFRDVTTGECLPCSRCHGNNPHQIVEECFNKLGHSPFLCQPATYLYAVKAHMEVLEPEGTTTELFKAGPITTFEIADSFLISVYVLGLVLASSVIFVFAYVCVQNLTIQKILRTCRDMTCDCDENMHPPSNIGETRISETLNDHDRVSTDAREDEDEKSILLTCEEANYSDVISGSSSSCLCYRENMSDVDDPCIDVTQTDESFVHWQSKGKGTIIQESVSLYDDVTSDYILRVDDVSEKTKTEQDAKVHCQKEFHKRRQRKNCVLKLIPFKAQYIYHTI